MIIKLPSGSVKRAAIPVWMVCVKIAQQKNSFLDDVNISKSVEKFAEKRRQYATMKRIFRFAIATDI